MTTAGLTLERQRAGRTSAPYAGSTKKFEAPRARPSPCGDGARHPVERTARTFEIGSIVRIASQEFLRKIGEIEPVEATCPVGPADHEAPPSMIRTTSCTALAAFPDRGPLLPITGDACFASVTD